MLILSELLIGQYELTSFEQLVELIKLRAREGEIFIQLDVAPPFPDTPENWESRLEAEFTSAKNFSQ